MRCLLCNGEMEKSNVSYTIDRKGYHMYIEEIPAHVCVQCGEKFFEENEVAAIQEMIENFENKLRKIQKAS